MTNDFESIAHADVMLVIGSNTTEAHPVIGSWLKERKKSGARLIVCDPRQIELADYADLYLRQRGGSDVPLLNAIMHVILHERLYDEKFVAERIENLGELQAAMAEYTPEVASQITGVPAEAIVQAARIYAAGPNSAIFYTMGITQHINGTDNVRSIANLALLCGMLGRPGTGVNPLRGQNNVQGACDMGCVPTWLPGYQKLHLGEIQDKVLKFWGQPLPTTPGKTVVRMMQAAHHGEIKGMFIMGENPMVSDPDSDHARQSLSKLDFLVVQDIFLTETAALADVVLPAACGFEKDGTFTNTCRAVQRVRKVVGPPGQAWSDWRILTALANHCGRQWNFNSAEEIFAEISSFTPSYGGISYQRLENGPLMWPCPTVDHPGTPILHRDSFPRPGGKARFVPCRWQAPAEWPDDDFPFLASTGRLLYHYHTGSMTRRSAPHELINALEIELNPQDAAQLKVIAGGKLKVTSRRGNVVGAAKITEKVAPGTVFLPFHFGEAPANAITSDAVDPVSETLATK